MNLPGLKQALEDGGAAFEAVIIDACLMANMETAWAVRDSARWMIASEEDVPGKGTAVRDWLQELYFFPEMDGYQLGRNICDMTLARYANGEDRQSRDTLTWSVVDLSRTERLTETLDRLFQWIGEAYRGDPVALAVVAKFIRSAEEYGDGSQDMRDISDVLYNLSAAYYLDRTVRNETLAALADAVAYTVRGSGRSGARGLSFCYPPDHSPAELDVYALNCPCPHYLALLDAVTGWSAPETVYETAERLPEVNALDELKIRVSLTRDENGFPLVAFPNSMMNIGSLYYRLYRQDEATGETVCLGKTTCVLRVDEESGTYAMANEPWIWPHLDGYPCTMELVMEKNYDEETVRVYNIPVQIGTDTYYLRCRQVNPFGSGNGRHYDVYGVWEKYDNNSQMANRNVIRISQLAGQEYRLLSPLDLKETSVKYIAAGPYIQLKRYLGVSEEKLPEGTYWLEYEVEDQFMHGYTLPRLSFVWNGEKASFPGDEEWEGERVLN